MTEANFGADLQAAEKEFNIGTEGADNRIVFKIQFLFERGDPLSGLSFVRVQLIGAFCNLRLEQ
jgi:hypothetical protein